MLLMKMKMMILAIGEARAREQWEYAGDGCCRGQMSGRAVERVTTMSVATSPAQSARAIARTETAHCQEEVVPLGTAAAYCPLVAPWRARASEMMNSP